MAIYHITCDAKVTLEVMANDESSINRQWHTFYQDMGRCDRFNSEGLSEAVGSFRLALDNGPLQIEKIA